MDLYYNNSPKDAASLYDIYVDSSIIQSHNDTVSRCLRYYS